MFKGIKLRTLLSTPEEWHALAIGFFEVLCPWPSRYHLTMKPMGKLLKEYHYYLAGRGTGFVALLLTLWGIITLIKEALI